MTVIKCKRLALALSLLAMPLLLSACGSKEEPVSTAPTTSNPQAFPGMENAKGTSLRVGRDGGDATGGPATGSGK